jgi:hypothetical protein
MLTSLSRSLIVTFILSSSMAFASGGGLIGNGGDSLKRGSTFVLRDLVQFDATLPKTDEGASTADQYLQHALESASRIQSLGLNLRILASELSKLRGVHHRFPVAMLNVIESLQYSFITEDLPLLPDRDWNDAIDPRTQVAIRTLTGVQISLKAWGQLDERNRVALILHEAFYALGRAECSVENCAQSAERTRWFTGVLFKTVKQVNQDYSHFAQRHLFLDGLDECAQQTFTLIGQSRFSGARPILQSLAFETTVSKGLLEIIHWCEAMISDSGSLNRRAIDFEYSFVAAVPGQVITGHDAELGVRIKTSHYRTSRSLTAKSVPDCTVAILAQVLQHQPLHLAAERSICQ